MGRDGVLAATLLILVLVRISDASSGANRRFLMAEGKGHDKPDTEKASPSPTPDASPKVNPFPGSSPKPPPKAEQPPLDAGKSNGTGLKGQPESGRSASVTPPPSGPESNAPQSPNTGDHGKGDKDSKGSASGRENKSPQGPNAEEHDKKDEDPKGSHGPAIPGNTTDTSQEVMCNASSEKCHVADLFACLQHPGNESKELYLLVQNGGGNDLTLKITTSIHNDVKMLSLAKHSNETINVSTNATDVVKIVLDTGKETCTLHIRPSVPDWNPFQQFPAYATLLSPIYGAYLLFFTMVIAGGTWACCKFGRKARRGDAGVPYQQLEMGIRPESSSAVTDANTADGWDQSWDDDWDEEAVARPSKKPPAGNVSSNGLTSRPPNKDGWDVDWDD